MNKEKGNKVDQKVCLHDQTKKNYFSCFFSKYNESQ